MADNDQTAIQEPPPAPTTPLPPRFADYPSGAPAPASMGFAAPPAPVDTRPSVSETMWPKKGGYELPGTGNNAGYTMPEPSDDELKQKSTDELWHYFGTSNDVNSDRAADFYLNRLKQDNQTATYEDRKASLASDFGQAAVNAVNSPWYAPGAIVNFIREFGKQVGDTTDKFLQSHGAQITQDYRNDLQDQLKNGMMTEDQVNSGLAALDQIDEIRAQRLQGEVPTGVEGLPTVPKATPDELADEQAKITELFYKADPQYAKVQAAKAAQELMVGTELTNDKLNKLQQYLATGFDYFDPLKYFTGKSEMAGWSHDHMKNALETLRAYNIPLQEHAAGLMQGPWDPFLRTFNQWDENWRKEAGLLPRFSEYTSPEQLAAQGRPLSPQTIQNISNFQTNLIGMAAGEGAGPAMEDVARLGLKGASRLTELGAKGIGAFSPTGGNKVLKWIPIAAQAIHSATHGGDPMALLQDAAWDTAIEGGLFTAQKFGHAWSDALQNAALQNYNGGGFLAQAGGRISRLTAEGLAKSLPMALITSSGDPDQFLSNYFNLAALHIATGAPSTALKTLAGGTGDYIWARPGKVKDTQPIAYRVDPQLDSQSHANLSTLDPNTRNLAATAQQWLRGNVDLYYLNPTEMQDYQNRFGANAQQDPRGFIVYPNRTGTGRAAAFIDISHINEAMPHEFLGHPLYWLMDQKAKDQIGANVLKYNDPDKFIRDNYNQNLTYDSLPDHPNPANPAQLSKDMIREEMSVEEIGRYFNGGSISDFYKDKPGLNRSLRYGAGKIMERLGLPTSTFESTSDLGINPTFANSLLIDGAYRSLIKKQFLNPTINPAWPTEWPKYGETWQDTTARQAQRNAPQQQQAAQQPGPGPTGAGPGPTGGGPAGGGGPGPGGGGGGPQPQPTGGGGTTTATVPQAPPAQEAIARRAYEISQEREAKGTPGDATSDWLQAEEELKSGEKEAPKKGPEAPSPGTPAVDSPEYHAAVEELANKGVPQGEARAAVEGRTPKTLEQENAPPQARDPKVREDAIKGLQALGIKKAEAADHVDNVPGATTEDVVKNALKRRDAMKRGQMPQFMPGAQESEAPETIRAAAIQHIPTGKVTEGFTHYDAALAAERSKDPNNYHVGFTTSTGRFVDRDEAHQIAKAAGQIGKTGDERLGAEDLGRGRFVPPGPQFMPGVGPKPVWQPGAGISSRVATALSPVVVQQKEQQPPPAPGEKEPAPQPTPKEETPQPTPTPTPQVTPKQTTGYSFPEEPAEQKPAVTKPTVTAPTGPSAKQAPTAQKSAAETQAETRGNVIGVKGTEFGEVDNPIYGGYTEKGWNIGAWGDRLDGKDNRGFALPVATLKHFNYAGQKDYGKYFNSNYVIRVTNPKTGKTTEGPLKDLGPGADTGASIDMLYKSREDLGLQPNFAGGVGVEIIDKKTGKVAYQLSGKEIAEGGGGMGARQHGVGAAPGAATGGGPGGEVLPYTPGTPPQTGGVKPAAIPSVEEAMRMGAGTGGGGGGYYPEEGHGGGMPMYGMPWGQQQAMVQQMITPQAPEAPAQYTVPQAAIRGATMGLAPSAPGISYMPARGRLGGITPEGEEEGEPVESTLGEPNVRGFNQLAPLLGQRTTEATKQAQKLHARLLSADDTRVKKQADNFFKGEHFVEGDPMHQHMLLEGNADHPPVPANERLALAAGQTAITNKAPMHVSYVSAPPSPEKESPITRQSREVNYEASSPQARLLGQTNGRLAGHSFIPTSIGISIPQKKGLPHNGYIQGISTNVAAHNHYHLNQALAEMGEESPYPELNSPKFRNDFRAYIQNLQAGHTGTGEKYQKGTEDFPANPDRNYVPARLKRREADFLNAIINNQSARHSKAQQELAKKAGTLLTEQGEVNPLRHAIDIHKAAGEIKDEGIKKAAENRWSNKILEPTIRTFNAGLIHSLHETPQSIPEAIRPKLPGYEQLTKTLGTELGGERGRPDVPIGVNYMPAGRGAGPQFKRVSPEEFITQRNKSKRPQYLSELTPEDIREHQLYTNHEGTTGVAIDPHGDIQNVFNNGGPQGAGAHAVAHAIAHGGRTLDAYDHFLPAYYRQFGFQETGRMKFNRAYAKSNWDYEKDDEPDVVFMGWNGYPEGGREAAIARATRQAPELPNERASNYYQETDWDRAKDESRAYAQRAGTGRVGGAGAEEEAERPGGAPGPGAGPPSGRAVEAAPAFMPMAGRKAKGWAQAEQEGRTFETPLAGPEGHPTGRFEISDLGMKLKPAPKGSPHDTMLEHNYHKSWGDPMPLDEAIDHPELFENYPQLRKTKITMDPNMRAEGYYHYPYSTDEGNPAGDEIHVREPQDRGTIAHEIQHAVQHIENFPRGTSMDEMLGKLYGPESSGLRDEVQKAAAEAHPMLNRKDWLAKEIAEGDWRTPPSKSWADANYKDYVAAVNRSRTSLIARRMQQIAYSLYRRAPGELEAVTTGDLATPPPAGKEYLPPKEALAAMERLTASKYPMPREMGQEPPPYLQPGFQTAASQAPAYMAASKKAKPKKSPEQIAAEKEDLRQAAIDREDITPEERAQLDRIQKIAQKWVKNNPELPEISAHHHLEGKEEFPAWVKTKEDIGKYFGQRNKRLDFSNPQHQEIMAHALVHDVMRALAKKSSAYGWYDRTVDKSLRHVAQIAPKILTDPQHAMAFMLSTAITSQGQDVFPNFESGYMGYRHWVKTGKFPVDPKLFGEGPIGGGTKSPAMIANFKKIQELWDDHDYEGLKKILETKMTVRELREKYGKKLGAGESPDHEMEGAALLGPKIGSFFNNLNKRFHSITFDLWASRTMNRLAGNMMKFSPSSLLKDKFEETGEMKKPSHLTRLENLIENGGIEGADEDEIDKMREEAGALRELGAKPSREKVLKVAPTIADWADREHNRYAKGTGGRSYPKELKTESSSLAKNMDLNFTDLSDAPRGPKQRKYWRDIFGLVQDKMRDAGIDMEHANNQAVLWFLEQALFKKGGSRNRASFDYLDAAHRLVRKVKSGELPPIEEPLAQAA